MLFWRDDALGRNWPVLTFCVILKLLYPKTALPAAVAGWLGVGFLISAGKKKKKFNRQAPFFVFPPPFLTLRFCNKNQFIFSQTLFGILPFTTYFTNQKKKKKEKRVDHEIWDIFLPVRNILSRSGLFWSIREDFCFANCLFCSRRDQPIREAINFANGLGHT